MTSPSDQQSALRSTWQESLSAVDRKKMDEYARKCLDVQIEPHRARIRDLLAERQKQDAKWGDQSSNHDAIWLGVLTEEVGECAKAMLHTIYGGPEADKLRWELVQTAAVAMAWIEAIDRRGHSREHVEHG